MEEDTGVALRGELPAQLRAAVAFVDISGFTLLADAMGDAAAAEVLGRFSHLVREAAAQREGRIVKQIGDAFMLVFPNPRQAVACLIDIDHRAAEQHQFPALRSAAHWGDVLYREGDYLGANVNIAARLASDAERHQVLVTAAVRTAAAALPEVEFTRLGRKCLKGVSEEIEVFEVRRRAGGVLPRRAVDPVCGMELNAEDIAAELTIDGRQQAFCSHNCLQRFVAAPARYKVEPQRGTPPR